MLGLLDVRLYKKAIALALAAVVLAAVFSVVPTPLTGSFNESVSAHHQHECRTYWTVTYPNASGLGRRGEPVLVERTQCYVVQHPLPRDTFANGLAGGLVCGGGAYLLSRNPLTALWVGALCGGGAAVATETWA